LPRPKLRRDSRHRVSKQSKAGPLPAAKATGYGDVVTFAARPSRSRRAPRGTTIQTVKAYRIERIKGGMKFTCTHCAHSVSTLDFDPKAGNLRTQAATAINDHATQAHHEPLVVSASEGQQRSWR